MKPNIFHGHYLTFKLPSRLFAILIVIFLAAATYTYSYQTIVWMRDLFPKDAYEQQLFTETIARVVGVLVAAAAVVQGVGFIWDRLSYWGQALDNFFVKLLFRKKYFLDEAEDLLNEVRKLINIANKELFDIYKLTLKPKELDGATQQVLAKLNQQLETQLEKAEQLHTRAVNLLKKNEPFDNINRERKNTLETSLNNLIVQLSDTMRCNRTTHKQIRKIIEKSGKQFS